MRFKNDSDAVQYRMISGPYAGEANLLLRTALELFDQISQFCGFGEITITSYIREESSTSQHHYGRAADIDIHYLPKEWYMAMVTIGAAMEKLSKRAAERGEIRFYFRINSHHELYGTPDAHIHIEMREWHNQTIVA